MPEQLHESVNNMQNPKAHGSKVFFIFALFFFFASFILFGMLYSSNLFMNRDRVSTDLSLMEVPEETEKSNDYDSLDDLLDNYGDETTPSSSDPNTMIDEELEYMDSLNIEDFENDYRETTLNDL